ncbi:MAG: helix-turn-helix domain-containing protein [Clostridia bacterium]
MTPSELTRLMMNPARLRIIQHLLLHPTATTSEIGRDLSDIAPASLYRHVKMLEQAGILLVDAERRVRGAVEKTYRLNQELGAGAGDAASGIQQMLLHLMGTFSVYFSQPAPAPEKDMLFISTSTLMLSDAEFTELLGKMGALVNDYLENAPSPDRAARRITWISSPREADRAQREKTRAKKEQEKNEPT